MEVQLGGVVNTLAEGIVQNKIADEASLVIGTVVVKGRIYQVQMTLEPMKANHIEAGKIVSQGKVVVEDTRTLFPDLAEEENDNESSEKDEKEFREFEKENPEPEEKGKVIRLNDKK